MVYILIGTNNVIWYMWVPVNLTGKVSDGYIRDLGFNSTYTKNWLVSWFDDKELSLGADAIDWNSLKMLYDIWVILIKYMVKKSQIIKRWKKK